MIRRRRRGRGSRVVSGRRRVLPPVRGGGARVRGTRCGAAGGGASGRDEGAATGGGRAW